MIFEPLDFLKVAVESGNISNVREAILLKIQEIGIEN